MSGDADQTTREQVLDLLARLHRQKDAAYGDAWRKRGEVIAIFTNLARKYDRLVVAFDEERPAATDALADTIGDLCVYAAKYLTWLAETQPQVFASQAPDIDVQAASATSGPSAVEVIFHYLPRWESDVGCAVASVTEAWDRTRTAFDALDAGLMSQASTNPVPGSLLTWPRKVQLAWDLTSSTSWLLERLNASDRRHLDGLRDAVQGMEEVAT